MRIQGQANCPLNERRQIQANSRGDRDEINLNSLNYRSVVPWMVDTECL